MIPLVAALLDLLLPPSCPGCGIEGVLLCRTCRRPLERRLDEPPGAPVGLAVLLPPGLVQLEWCASFSGPTRAALHALKYDGEQRLAKPLGELLAARWRRAGAGGDLLVPVPIHPDRHRERGFNQAALLALAAGKALRLPVIEPLARGQATDAQYGLGRRARQANVGRAFVATAPGGAAIRGRWIVLVDDVTTTGATLSGCAAALLEAGALAVSGLTVARER
jgi:ComF family protein